jgi:hypothetical protein
MPITPSSHPLQLGTSTRVSTPVPMPVTPSSHPLQLGTSTRTPVPMPVAPLLRPLQLGMPLQTQDQPLSPLRHLPQISPSSRSSTTSPIPRRWPVNQLIPEEDHIDNPAIPGASPRLMPRQHLPLDTSSWPQHALDVYRYLMDETATGVTGEKVTTTRDWGDEWVTCVKGFMEFQKSAGFPVSL